MTASEDHSRLSIDPIWSFKPRQSVRSDFGKGTIVAWYPKENWVFVAIEERNGLFLMRAEQVILCD